MNIATATTAPPAPTSATHAANIDLFADLSRVREGIAAARRIADETTAIPDRAIARAFTEFLETHLPALTPTGAIAATGALDLILRAVARDLDRAAKEGTP